MNEKIQISTSNAKISQIFVLLQALLMMTVLGLFLALDFSYNLLLLGILFFLLAAGTTYHSTRTWNVYYQDGHLHFENLYKSTKRPVNLFKSVESLNSFTRIYKLTLTNSENFYFFMNHFRDLKEILKNDSYYFDKILTDKIDSYVITKAKPQI